MSMPFITSKININPNGAIQRISKGQQYNIPLFFASLFWVKALDILMISIAEDH